MATDGQNNSGGSTVKFLIREEDFADLDRDATLLLNNRSENSDLKTPSNTTAMSNVSHLTVDAAEKGDIKSKSSFANLRSRSRGGISFSFSSHKKSVLSHGLPSGTALALYEDEPTPLLSAFISSFTMPGPTERDKWEIKKKKANLGVLIGVYLPTLQHIFGVLMFLRLMWIVGSAGIIQAVGMVFLCCLCTFLTSISMSAIATNGVVESGGSYFMISRNLGPEFGSAVGLLFYLANTVATAMYLVGGVEIFLLYIVPQATIGGSNVHEDTSLGGMMANNFRLYASILLVIEFCIVAMGVRFVQFFAPVSLCCVIISILSIYAGAIHKTVDTNAGPNLCMLGDRLLKYDALVPENGEGDICAYCDKNSSLPVWRSFCEQNLTDPSGWTCQEGFVNLDLRCVQGMPGLGSGLLSENSGSVYMKAGETVPGVKAQRSREVFQDITTNFFKLLAIYFPSVTGILTGSNMSGDLKDPQQSIPIGTLAAQLTTSFVYLSFVVVFGGTITGALLRDKYGHSLGSGMVVAELAWPSRWVLLIGSFTSTFGAALQCICSAPRLLQSIAKDDVIPLLRPFSEVTKRNEPFRGLILTVCIAELAILIGAVDYIAPVVDLFFLMCYAFVNLVCVLHSLLGAPNWRPRFRFYHWTLSLLGAILCFFIMFATYWYYALVSIALCLIIYRYVQWKGAKKEWGDGMRGLALTTAQYSLMKIEDKDPHPKNWRPQILVLLKFTGALEPKYRKLIDLSSQLKAGKGLTMLSSLIQGDPTRKEDRDKANEVKEKMKAEMKEARLKGFSKAVIYEEHQLASSVSTLIQSAGISGLKPNTLMVGWPHAWKNASLSGSPEYWDFIDKVYRGAALDMCLIIPKGIESFPGNDERLTGFVDVWWILHDGGLLILLSFLLNQHKVWRGCKLRLFAVAQEHDNSIQMKKDLESWLYQLRIMASVHVVEFSDPTISAYAYERTLGMEARSKYLRGLQLTEKERKQIPGLVVEKHRGTSIAGLEKMNAKIESQKSVPEAQQKKSVVEEQPFFTPPETVKEQNKPKTRFAPVVTISEAGAETDRRESKESAESSSEEVLSDTDTEPVTEDGLKHLPSTKSHKSYQFTFTPGQVAQKRKEELEIQALDRRKVKKMHTAVRLNQKLRELSADSQLVVLNLPKPPHSSLGLHNYMEYLEALTDKLERVLLVRGSGTEVITMYS